MKHWSPQWATAHPHGDLPLLVALLGLLLDIADRLVAVRHREAEEEAGKVGELRTSWKGKTQLERSSGLGADINVSATCTKRVSRYRGARVCEKGEVRSQIKLLVGAARAKDSRNHAQ